MRLPDFPVLFFAFLLASPAFADSEPPAGLVMALSGTTDPPIAAMSEIPPGSPMRLGPGAELTFLHYYSCKLITVAGGTLSVTRTDFTTDGNIVSDKDGPCPRIHQIRGNVSGGLVMRGGGSAPRWPLNPEIIVAGAGTDGIRAAAIYAEDRVDAPLLSLEVSGHRVRFPESAPRLAANARYLLRLTIANRADPVDIAFIGAPRTGPSLLVLLREP